MSTTRETVLAALHARLLPIAALVQRDEILPERIPTSGLIILRDGHDLDGRGDRGRSNEPLCHCLAAHRSRHRDSDSRFGWRDQRNAAAGQ